MADPKADKAATAPNDPAELAGLSRDADKSTYKSAPVPKDVTPAPGPSTIQELGKP